MNTFFINVHTEMQLFTFLVEFKDMKIGTTYKSPKKWPQYPFFFYAFQAIKGVLRPLLYLT